jgi:rRNA maturation protein Rpf1
MLITTSRRPTPKMRTLCNDLARVLSNAIRLNRGKLSLQGLKEHALSRGVDRLIVVERRKGGPGLLRFYQFSPGGVWQMPLTVSLGGVTTQDDIGRRIRLHCEAVTITEVLNGQLDKIAAALARFLKVPVIRAPMAPSHHASLDVSSHSKYVATLSFSAPSTGLDSGPTLVVKRAIITDV